MCGSCCSVTADVRESLSETIELCVVIATVGCVAAWMEVGKHKARRCRSTSRVRGEDIRSHRPPDAQLSVGSSRNLTVFLERPLHGMPPEGSG